jgi:exosortase H (IPTLxxWG-CTERM-specific)
MPEVVAEGGGPPAGQEPWLRFALVFGALAITSEVLYYAVALDSRFFDAYLGVLAEISGHMLRAFGSEVDVSGTRITGMEFAVAVAQGCDAIQVCSLLAAAVIAFPVSWAARLRGLAIGIGLLQALNIVRIVSLYWVGAYFSDYFQTAHEMVWPGILIAVTIATWILWVRWETPLPASVSDAT